MATKQAFVDKWTIANRGISDRVGKPDNPRITYNTILSRNARIGEIPQELRHKDGEIVGLLSDADVRAYHKQAKRFQHKIDKVKGKRKAFKPLKEQRKGEKPELPRYEPKPVDRGSRIVFTGRDKMKVKGFGPFG